MPEHKRSWKLRLGNWHVMIKFDTSRFMGAKGQGHSLTFDQGLSYFDNFKKDKKAPGPIVTQFHI